MKFSIVVLYSPDRVNQFLNSVACWEDCAGFGDCEKIVCVDGQCNFELKDWKTIEIKRKNDLFCWSDALNSGINASKNDSIFYFDSDRIVPINFFEIALKTSIDNKKSFVYPRNLFSLKQNYDLFEIRNIRDNLTFFSDCLIPDHRQDDPMVLSRKNPFSGCVCFNKKDYFDLGGYDPNFLGWGYPDYDFLMTVVSRKYKLISLDINELHQFHPYKIQKFEFELHYLYNLYQYLKKWNLPFSSLEQKCFKLNVNIDILKNSKNLIEFMRKQHCYLI